MNELKDLSVNEEFIGVYNKEKIHRKDINTAKFEGYNEGHAEGISQGYNEAKLEDARRMLEKNISLEDISDITGLSSEYINSLK